MTENTPAVHAAPDPLGDSSRTRCCLRDTGFLPGDALYTQDPGEVTCPAEVIYHGVFEHTSPHTGDCVVLVESPGGGLLRRLEHIVRHSPTGIGWGHSGSGAADLARSLLFDAAGDGTSQPGRGAGASTSALMRVRYMNYKREVIARLPEPPAGWRMPRSEVRRFLAREGVGLWPQH